jgi:hypothetical protein
VLPELIIVHAMDAFEAAVNARREIVGLPVIRRLVQYPATMSSTFDSDKHPDISVVLAGRSRYKLWPTTTTSHAMAAKL